MVGKDERTMSKIDGEIDARLIVTGISGLHPEEVEVGGKAGIEIEENRIRSRSFFDIEAFPQTAFSEPEETYKFEFEKCSREMFMSALEMAKVHQLERIATALEKLTESGRVKISTSDEDHEKEW
jgi:hypothetical protein